MLHEMASLGGHALQNSDSVAAWFGDRFPSQITPPDCLFLIAELDADTQAIGFLEASIKALPPIFQPQSSLHIHAIYVMPQHRRSGVGRSLLEAAFQWGQEKGCTEADLNVLQNSPAKFLYASLEFEPFQIEMRRKL